MWDRLDAAMQPRGPWTLTVDVHNRTGKAVVAVRWGASTVTQRGQTLQSALWCLVRAVEGYDYRRCDRADNGATL